MSQKTVSIELTENQARMVRWALDRAVQVSSARIRGIPLWKALTGALEAVETATTHLEDIPLPHLSFRK